MNLFGFLLPPWVRPALCAVALSGAFSAGWYIEGLRWTAHEAKALKQAQIGFERQLARQNKESASYEQDRERGRVANDARQQQVRIIYRDKVVPAECEPGPDALGVLDDAISEANKPSGQSR